mgnify:CR=1 FL=1
MTKNNFLTKRCLQIYLVKMEISGTTLTGKIFYNFSNPRYSANISFDGSFWKTFLMDKPTLENFSTDEKALAWQIYERAHQVRNLKNFIFLVNLCI